MRIYIAGPYTKGDVSENIHNAIVAGDIVANMGHKPFIPHLTHFWHMLIPHNYEFWMEQDKEWLLACDALLRLPGESSGADREVELAKEIGITVYNSTLEIPEEED